MPTYEYLCNACKHEFEQFQSIMAGPTKKCPKCGKLKVIRKISMGGAIIFKGGGFYETDYRSENYKKSAESEKPAATKSESKTDGKEPAKATDAKGADAKPAETKASEPKPLESKPAEPSKPVKKSKKSD